LFERGGDFALLPSDRPSFLPRASLGGFSLDCLGLRTQDQDNRTGVFAHLGRQPCPPSPPPFPLPHLPSAQPRLQPLHPLLAGAPPFRPVFQRTAPLSRCAARRSSPLSRVSGGQRAPFPLATPPNAPRFLGRRQGVSRVGRSP